MDFEATYEGVCSTLKKAEKVFDWLWDLERVVLKRNGQVALNRNRVKGGQRESEVSGDSHETRRFGEARSRKLSFFKVWTGEDIRCFLVDLVQEVACVGGHLD